MTKLLSNFYNNLSSDGIFFFWIIVFLFIFLIALTIILIIKNKKLIKLIKEEEINEQNNIKEENINITKEEIKIEPPKEQNHLVEEPQLETINIPKEETKETSLYQKNVLREMNGRKQTSPINIEKKEEIHIQEDNLTNYDNGLGMTVESQTSPIHIDRGLSEPEDNYSINNDYTTGIDLHEDALSPLEMMEDAYEVNDNMKFASDIVEKMEEEIKPSNIELTDYERKQEEEAIISYDELLKVKDKIYNITDDEETDEFIDELKNLRTDLQ